MVKILINGANGRMGKKVKELCLLTDGVQAVCGVDLVENLSDNTYPIYSSFDSVKEDVDVIIDFSSPSSLDNELNFAIKTSTPVVLCPTGFTEDQIEKIKDASKKVALFRSANMSIGVNAIISAVKEVAKKLTEAEAKKLSAILEQDPRPSYKAEDERSYGMKFEGKEVTFKYEEGKLLVTNIE